MSKAKIYHNPRCSKSRQALALLREHGIEPEIVEYLQTPPQPAELQSIAKKLKLSANEMIRHNEPIYQQLQLNKNLTEQQLFTAMSNNPILIQRPIVVIDNKACIGRPPENILEII